MEAEIPQPRGHDEICWFSSHCAGSQTPLIGCRSSQHPIAPGSLCQQGPRHPRPGFAIKLAAFYRIAGESLNNIQKHARAKNVTINLKCDSNDVRLVIADDGQGFDLGKKSASRFGITFMNERAEKAGIDFKIESVFHHGTTVRATWLTY